MKNKKNLIIILGFIFLLIVYFVSRKIVLEKRNPNKPIVKINVSKVEEFEFFNGKKNTLIRKNDKDYFFVSPFEDKPAEKESIEEFINVLNKLTIRRDLGKVDKNDILKFGILPVSPYLNLNISGRKISLIMGARNPVAPQNYIYLEESNDLYLTDDHIEKLFYLGPEFFRNRKLFDHKIEELNFVEIKRKGNIITAKKEAEDWYYNKQNEKKEYLCDTNKIRLFLSTLANIEVADFKPKDNDYTLSKCGLVSPKVTLKMEFNTESSTNAIETIGFGNPYEKDKVYVSVNNEVMGGVNSMFLKNLDKSATTYARYDIIDFPLQIVLSFVSKTEKITYIYEKKRGKWYKTGRHKRGIKEDKVYEFFINLSNIKIEKFFFNEELGEIEKEYIFYNRVGDVLTHILVGEKKDGYVKIKFKDKRGILGIPINSYAALNI